MTKGSRGEEERNKKQKPCMQVAICREEGGTEKKKNIHPANYDEIVRWCLVA